MSLFQISYLVLWFIVVMQTYLLIQVSKTKQARPIKVENNDYTLIHEDHGIPQGERFPQMQFRTVNKGSINLNRIPANGGFLIAVTSLSCNQCKVTYPILEKYNKKFHSLQIIVLSEGQEEDVIQNMHNYQLTMPVVPISDISEYQTSYAPFFYYLSPQGEVIAKSVILEEEQLLMLLNKGNYLQVS
ncbi:TlpA family protein disulfide reductase [Paenibacillus solani]|uniref:TlpA family protein disulfide reductase n=1 Tax=Paenibacillus solani TaxID=1705565 RepID=UPI003D280F16